MNGDACQVAGPAASLGTRQAGQGVKNMTSLKRHRFSNLMRQACRSRRADARCTLLFWKQVREASPHSVFSDFGFGKGLWEWSCLFVLYGAEFWCDFWCDGAEFWCDFLLQ